MGNPNKKVMTVMFNSQVSVVGVDEEGIEFSDGSKMSHFHGQDCCEHVYANWIDWSNDFTDVTEITSLTVWTVPNAGIRIQFSRGWGCDSDFVWFVACYNEQNGYYSSDLAIIFSTGEKAFVCADVTGSTFFNEV